MNQFCGNPYNHAPHTKELPNGKSFWCEGVQREEVKETIVEKFTPDVSGTEDGTQYQKITIIIEEANGDSTIIHAPKSSQTELLIERESFVSLEMTRDGDFKQAVKKATFNFLPNKDGSGKLITIEKVDNNGKSAE